METIEVFCWEKKNKGCSISLTVDGDRFWYPLNKVKDFKILTKDYPPKLQITTNDPRFWEMKGANGSKH